MSGFEELDGKKKEKTGIMVMNLFFSLYRVMN